MTLAPPCFTSIGDYEARLGEPEFWRPYVAAALKRHNFPIAADLRMGTGSTFPVLMSGKHVVKLFGFGPRWRHAFETERLVLEQLGEIDQVSAPALQAHGALSDDWCYLILTGMSGRPWDEVEGDKRPLARQLGRQLACLHRLPFDGVPEYVESGPEEMKHAFGQASLPSRLLRQVPEFLDSATPGERAFVHGDLIARHVLIDEHRVCGILDWGDTLATDRHYELAKLHLDLFGCDKRLLEAFLISADWAGYSPQLAMAMALRRQLDCSAQHFTCDVFHRVPACVALEPIATLDALAEALFGL